MKTKISIFNFQFSISNRGFSLAEMVVVIGILTTLIGIGTISLLSAQNKTSLGATIDVFMADMKEQQVKAMVGDTQGSGVLQPYGIYFDSNKYTLFRGTYLPSESSNFSINLPSNFRFDSSSRPEIIFERGSGEVYQFSNGSNQIIIQNIVTGEIKTIKINRYGVITEVD